MDFINRKEYNVKSVKTSSTDRGYYFTGTLTNKGKIIASFVDKGDGGCMTIDFIKESDKDMLTLFLVENHLDISNNGEFLDTFIATLCDENDLIKKIKRARNKKTFFYLISDYTEFGPTLRELNLPYGEKALKYLENKYSENIGLIYNKSLEIFPDNYIS